MLALPDSVVDFLKHGTLETSDGIRMLESATTRLQQALQTRHEAPTGQVLAINERMQLFSLYSTDFAHRLIQFMTKLIQHQANLMADRERMSELSLPSHEALEEQLLEYRKLISWLKEMDTRKHFDLQMVYPPNVD
jgi:hypothetical protein